MAIATALSLPGNTRQEFGPHAEVHTLSNGLQVVLMEDHSAPVVALQTWVRYGSADEISTLRALPMCSSICCSKARSAFRTGKLRR